MLADQPSSTHSKYSDTDIAALATVLSAVSLSGEQQDRLSGIWLEASSSERKVIARMYSQYFTNPTFIQRLQGRAAAQRQQQPKKQQQQQQQPAGSVSAVGPSGSKSAAKLQRGRVGKGARGGDGSAPLTKKQRMLRNAVENAMCKLEGPGPHPISFGVVSDATQNQAAIELYSTQFRYPDPPELARIVTVPRRLSTRTRQKTSGNYTWYLSALSRRELACAVTVTVHKVDPLVFIEMPLFATNAGYKKMGLARLLNAALQEHCCRINCDFIMVSADQAAVGFWMSPSLGYVPIPSALRSRIEFHYTHECRKFNGTELLVWVPPTKDPASEWYGTDHVPNLVEASLARMPRFVLQGPSKLPLP